MDRFSYASVSHENDHSDFGWASHGTHGLRTIRGSTPNRASYRMSGLDTQTIYNFSAWVIANSPGQRAMLEVRETNGTVIDSVELGNVGNPPNYDTTWNEWSGLSLNFVPTASTVDIVLSDSSTAQGTALYWDFVEFEDVYSIPNTVPPVPGPISSEDVLEYRALVSWGASVDPQGDPLTYDVEYRRDDLSDHWSDTVTTSSTAITLTGLQPDTNYRVRVRASDSETTSDWLEAQKLFTTLPVTPTRDIGEFGMLTNVTDAVQTVILNRTYDDPVVLAQSSSTNGQDAVVVRVSNVETDRFSIRVAESSAGDGTHNDETVSYLVLEAGSHWLPDGTRLEAGTVTTSATVGGSLTNQWETVDLPAGVFSSTPPVVLTQIQTAAGDAFSGDASKQYLLQQL